MAGDSVGEMIPFGWKGSTAMPADATAAEGGARGGC